MAQFVSVWAVVGDGACSRVELPELLRGSAQSGSELGRLFCGLGMYSDIHPAPILLPRAVISLVIYIYIYIMSGVLYVTRARRRSIPAADTHFRAFDHRPFANRPRFGRNSTVVWPTLDFSRFGAGI